jgi:hypothetical protein
LSLNDPLEEADGFFMKKRIRRRQTRVRVDGVQLSRDYFLNDIPHLLKF